MAQFIAINKDVEVSGASVLSLVNSMRKGQEARLATMAKHGIVAEIGQWYLQQNVLDALREIAETAGEMNLFLIGTAIASNAEFPPTIKTLEDGLRSIDIVHHLNHRLHGQVMFNPKTGEMLEGIGHSKVLEYNTNSRTAVVLNSTSYSSKVSEGLLWQIVQLFKPADSIVQEVKVDITKERRSEGGNSCTYLISW